MCELFMSQGNAGSSFPRSDSCNAWDSRRYAGRRPARRCSWTIPHERQRALEVDETWRATPVPTRSEALPLPADPEPSHTENID